MVLRKLNYLKKKKNNPVISKPPLTTSKSGNICICSMCVQYVYMHSHTLPMHHTAGWKEI